MIQTDLYKMATRFLGEREVPGGGFNPRILAMLRRDAEWPANDEVPWCSAFVNEIAHLCDVPRSRNLAARSWTEVGEPVELAAAEQGRDVVVFTRAGTPKAPHKDAAGKWLAGHVAIFAGHLPGGYVRVIGGNQRDAVSVATFPAADVIAVRRLV